MKAGFLWFWEKVGRFFNGLIPTVCLLCGSGLRGELVCPDCELGLPHLSLTEGSCRQCAVPLPQESSGDYCGHCLAKPPAFSCTVVPFRYQYPVDYLIHHFKYRRQLAAGRALGQALAQCVLHTYDEQDRCLPELIIPVPLHWTRRWLRGFNQTDLLGRQLATELKLPLASRACRRTRHTPAQKGLSRAKRQENLRQVFSMTAAGNRAIQGKRVALLDDVVTTTATARELSRLLIRQGAKEVHVWALARTPDVKPINPPQDQEAITASRSVLRSKRASSFHIS